MHRDNTEENEEEVEEINQPDQTIVGEQQDIRVLPGPWQHGQTTVSTWLPGHAQLVFLREILPTLSFNAPTAEELARFAISVWTDQACVLADIPLYRYDIHPRVWSRFLPPAYIHIVSHYAFGGLVPKQWIQGQNNWECSHLCESWWRGFLAEKKRAEKEKYEDHTYLLPSTYCVNPLHIRVERHSDNMKWAFCKQTWVGGCQCRATIPCTHFSKEQQRVHNILWDLWERTLDISHQHGILISDGWTLYTPAAFERVAPRAIELQQSNFSEQASSSSRGAGLEIIDVEQEQEELENILHWPPLVQLDEEFAQAVAQPCKWGRGRPHKDEHFKKSESPKQPPKKQSKKGKEKEKERK